MTTRLPAFALALALCAPSVLAADPGLAEKLDATLAEKFKPGDPGAAVIVVKDGKPVLRRAYGSANVELGVSNAPDTVFRIGSVTKQFTAIAVLSLVQDGKLRLEDEVTKFFPDYPAAFRKVTVAHLLSHTSGMKSYTDQPEFVARMRDDMSIAQILARTRDLPFDFDPGARFAYNNSGYVLLGAILEKVAGTSWQEFVRTRITEPLGMASTVYDRTEKVIPRRAAGYDRVGGEYRNAAFISMSQPYAAGGLLSTIDDLAAWNAGLLAGKIVGKELLDKAWTSARLPDGTATGYGFGWEVVSVEGHRVVRHDGGIPGFSTMVLTAPDDAIYVAVLMNRTNGPSPGMLAGELFRIAAGIERKERAVVDLEPAVLDRYVGRYELAPGFQIAVTREGRQLMAQGTGQGRFPIFAEREDRFFAKVVPADITFVVENGKATKMVLHQGGRDMPGPRVGDVEELETVELPPSTLDALAGEYQVAEAFSIRVWREGKKLMAQATNQPAFEMKALSPTRFVIPDVSAEIEFTRNGDGPPTGMVLRQGGRDVPAKRVPAP